MRKRVLSGGSGSREIQSVEQCSIVQDGESLSGRLIIRQKSGQTLEHQGVHIEFIGAVERHGEATSTASKKDIFQCSRVQLLAPMGDAAISKETVILEFDFGPLRMPFESYDGAGISLRYYLKAVVSRKMTDITRETTLWCCRGRGADGPPTTGCVTSPSLSASPPVELEVGLEEFLHIKLQLGRSRYTFNDEIRGLLRFLMVRVRIVDVEVNLVRKEVGVDDLLIQQTILTSKQLMDGPAHRGDQIPMQLDLASVADRLTTTMEAVNKMFSVRYYVGVILRDTEGRKYYKQVEVELVKGAELSAYLPNFKLGLISH